MEVVNGDLTKGQVLIWKTELKFDEGKTFHKSPVFEFQGREWYLEGSHVENATVALYLIRRTFPFVQDQVDAFYVDCRAQDQNEEKPSPRHPISFRRTKIDPSVFANWIFLNEHIVEKEIKDFCPHGKITFVLIFSGIDKRIYLKSQNADQSVQTNLDLEWENLSQSFMFLLENEDLPDVELKCGDCVIPAHKSVLAARSSVFLAMFRNRMLEQSSGVVDIPDVEIPVLKAFLKALYSGKFPDMSDDMVPKLYAVCDKYAVLSLKKLCSERMVNVLSEDNHQDYLLLANAHNVDHFKNSIIRFICDHPEFLRFDSWLEFSDTYPRLANRVYRNYLEEIVPLTGASSMNKSGL